MSSEPNNLVLAHLRAIRETQHEQTAALHVIGRRLSSVERSVAALHAQLGADTGTQIERTSDLEGRIERIERRLELRDSPQS